MTRAAKLKVLFLCTGNACRSQMAEGWARHLQQDCIDAYSAGIMARGLDPRAVTVMAEAGVDISPQRSKTMQDVADISFDYVVTLCGHARETCPVIPGSNMVHAGFDDPPQLAAECLTEEEKLDCYRRIRDQVKDFVQGLPDMLQ